MTLYVVLILLVAWGWWGIATVRDRRQSVGGGSSSIADFNDRLSVLERTGPAWQGPQAQPPAAGGLTAPRDRWATGLDDRQRSATRQLRDLVSGTPLESVTQRVLPTDKMTLSQAQARRRQMVTGLGAAVLVTGLLALLAGGVFTVMFALAFIATGAYLVMLVRARAEQIERAIKVRSIDRRQAAGGAYGAVSYGAEGDVEADWAVEAEAVGGAFASASVPMNGPVGRALGSYGDDAYGQASYGADAFA